MVKGFGMTELGATATTSFVGANEIGSVGIPLIKNNIKIVDTDTKEELPIGKTGELWISGPSIMMCYFNMETETSKAIVTDKNGDRWIRTGDLAHVNDDGLLFHDGRIRRIYTTFVNDMPAKIYPLQIEKAIKEVVGISACTVVGRTMENSAYYETVAFVVQENDSFAEDKLIEEMTAVCCENVPSYMQPAEYRFVDALPLTPIGKVDYRTLESLAAKS